MSVVALPMMIEAHQLEALEAFEPLHRGCTEENEEDILDPQSHIEAAKACAEAQLEALRSAERALHAKSRSLQEERQTLQAEQRRFFELVAAERAKGEKELARMREDLAAERARLEEERNAMRRFGEQQSDVVLLDVGGVHYKVSRQTLTSVPGSMLEAMFSGRHRELLRPGRTSRSNSDASLSDDSPVGAAQDDLAERVFIDRDGTNFAHILSFLREPRSRSTLLGAMSKEELRAVRQEADFFGLEDAMFPSPRRVMVFCGHDGCSSLRSTEVVDLETWAVTPGPVCESRRNFCAAAVLDRQHIIVVGGNGVNGRLNSTEILDLATMRFEPGPLMQQRRSGCAAVMMDQGRLLVCGGFDGSVWLKSTEVLDLSTMTFTSGPPLCARRNLCAACGMDSQRLIVVGGSAGSSFLESTEVLDVATMTFSPGPRMKDKRDGCAAAQIDAQRLLVMGGHDGVNWLNTTEVLNLSTMTFSDGPVMESRRNFCAAVAPAAGNLLVLGGHDGKCRLDQMEMLCREPGAEGQLQKFEAGPLLGLRRSGCAAVSC